MLRKAKGVSGGEYFVLEKTCILRIWEDLLNHKEKLERLDIFNRIN